MLVPYKVHYDGWNRRYDEWVPPDRVVKATPENVAKAEKVLFHLILPLLLSLTLPLVQNREEADKAIGGKERRPGASREGRRRVELV